MEIEFANLEQEIIRFLNDQKILVLATSANDRVTARSMSCVNIGLNIYFQTDRRFIKVQQIRQNPQVALCAENVQIEGTAKIGNHSLDSSNKEFIEVYQVSHPMAFQTYSHLKNNVVIEVKPELITLWKYGDGNPYREFLHIHSHRAEREYYDVSG